MRSITVHGTSGSGRYIGVGNSLWCLRLLTGKKEFLHCAIELNIVVL